MVASLSHPAYGALRPVTGFASVLLAANPSPMTLEGTNTWLLRAPGAEQCVVVDPGPDDPDHLAGLAGHAPVAHVLLTHRHPDHTDGARRFAELVGAPVHAVDPALRRGTPGLADGDRLEVAGLGIVVLATPGHTSDSVCFLVRCGQEEAVLTGDTVLGRGTTVIAHPDGTLGAYLASLRRLADLPPGIPALPGHGPELPDVAAAARDYLVHREQRLEQVAGARAQLRARLGRPPRVREIVELVYADVDPALWPAAGASVAAQVEYLEALEAAE